MKTLGPSAFVVYLLLVRRCDVDMCCFPSLNGISKDTGLSKPTVITAISKLEEAGLLTVERTLDSAGGPTRNHYNLMIVDEKGVVKNLAYLVKKFNYPSKENIPPPSKAVLPQEVLDTKKDISIRDINISSDIPKEVLPKVSKPMVKKVEQPEPMFDEEIPTRAKQADDKIWAAYIRIHEIADLGVPRGYRNKDEKPALAKALIGNIDAERIGIALQKALENDDPKFWPINRVINMLHILEATKRPQQQPQPKQSGYSVDDERARLMKEATDFLEKAGSR